MNERQHIAVAVSCLEAPNEPAGLHEYRARRMIRDLRSIYGTAGARELLTRIQNDEDERTGR